MRTSFTWKHRISGSAGILPAQTMASLRPAAGGKPALPGGRGERRSIGRTMRPEGLPGPTRREAARSHEASLRR